MFRIGLTIFFLSLAACAYSPQQITINPVIDTSGERYGEGRPVSVKVEDRRENKIIGSRGGIYKETSLITVSNDMGAAIVRATEAKLATQGFNVNSTAEQIPAQLTVVIEQLSYEVPEQSLGKKVMLKAVFLVEASSHGETYTGRYETSSQQQTVVTPNTARNEEMINALISETLARSFTDPKLKAFLSNI
ncbi:MAG: hypothetical protein JKY66_02695 [Spongiibacteraceae bacterium]|nr:hypothetical protein [Spongiibacteraceae bacterium]